MYMMLLFAIYPSMHALMFHLAMQLLYISHGKSMSYPRYNPWIKAKSLHLQNKVIYLQIQHLEFTNDQKCFTVILLSHGI